MLQPAHHRALQRNVDVVVGVGVLALVLLVGDVHTAGKAVHAIDHHDFAVRAKVDDRADAPPQPGGVKQGHLATGIQQGLVVASCQAFGTQGIDQQTHLHACARALGQCCQQALACGVGLKDVVLQMHMVLCLGNRLHDGIEGIGTTDQQLDALGGAQRQRHVAGQAHQLLQPFGRLRCFGAQVHQTAAHAGFTLDAQPLEAQPLKAPGTKDKVHQHPHHRQRSHGQQPAEGGHGGAALEHDPHGHQQQVRRPDQRQRQCGVAVADPMLYVLPERWQELHGEQTACCAAAL